METAAMLEHITYSCSNNERWGIFFNTKNTEVRKYILSLILKDAYNNYERWGVYTHTDDKSIQEYALTSMLEHAETFDELWGIYLCADDGLREHVLTMIEIACGNTLKYATTNGERWNVCMHATNPTLREEALAAILAHSTSNGERWEVFFWSRNALNKKRALSDMMTLRRLKKT